MTQYTVTFKHIDEEMHIRAANKVGIGAHSRMPDMSVWNFGADESAAIQAEARLRGDAPEITCEKYSGEVNSGCLPSGSVTNTGPGNA